MSSPYVKTTFSSELSDSDGSSVCAPAVPVRMSASNAVAVAILAIRLEKFIGVSPSRTPGRVSPSRERPNPHGHCVLIPELRFNFTGFVDFVFRVLARSGYPHQRSPS